MYTKKGGALGGTRTRDALLRTEKPEVQKEALESPACLRKSQEIQAI